MAALTTIGFAVSVICHEAVHVAIARKLGEKPRGLFLYIFGTGTPVELTSGTGWKRTKLYLSGFIFSFLLSGMFLLLSFLSETNGWSQVTVGILFHLAIANLSLALFQILPVLPLDGGRLLLNLFSREGHVRHWVLSLIYFFGNVVALSFAVVAGYQIYRERPILGAWIGLLGVLLFGANSEEYEYLRLRSFLDGNLIQDFMKHSPVVVSSSMTIKQFCSEILYKCRYKTFPVVKKGELLGFLHRKSIYRIPLWLWHKRLVTRITSKSSIENTVPPDMDAGTALSLMTHTGNPRLLVAEGKKVVGVVNYGDLLNAMKNPVYEAPTSRRTVL